MKYTQPRREVIEQLVRALGEALDSAPDDTNLQECLNASIRFHCAVMAQVVAAGGAPEQIIEESYKAMQLILPAFLDPEDVEDDVSLN